jgi:hypothetical protein
MLANALFLLIVLVSLALLAWRESDHRADRELMHRLSVKQPAEIGCFNPDMIADLPEPARRYFLYTIESGTPLYTVARITMTGRFGLGVGGYGFRLPTHVEAGNHFGTDHYFPFFVADVRDVAFHS